MVEPFADQVIGQIKQAAELYHRLMLVVAPAGAGKTTALQDVQERAGAPTEKIGPIKTIIGSNNGLWRFPGPLSSKYIAILSGK